MRTRVLLIGDVVGSYRTQNLVKGLMDRGIDVALVSPRFYESRDTAMSLGRRIVRKVQRLPARGVSFAEIVAKARLADVLYLLPMNVDLVPMALAARRFAGKPLIAEPYISAFETGIDRGLFASPTSAAARYAKALDRAILERSDMIVHLARYELSQIAAHVGARLDDRRVRIAPLAVDPKPLANPSASKEFRVAWWGTYINLHGLEKVFEAFALLRERCPNARLSVFGVAGAGHDEACARVARLGLGDRVSMRADASFANGMLERALATECDLALGIFGDSPKARAVIPNKIIDAFSMQLPVLTMRSAALQEMIRQDELFTCEADPAGMADAIARIAASPEERRLTAQQGRIRYQETFTPKAYVDTVIGTIRDLVAQSPHPHA